MNNNPYAGAEFVSRSNLRDIVRDSFQYDRELRQRRWEAVTEFNKRILTVSDTKKKFIIIKEVAAKYRFREEWFLTQVRI